MGGIISDNVLLDTHFIFRLHCRDLIQHALLFIRSQKSSWI